MTFLCGKNFLKTKFNKMQNYFDLKSLKFITKTTTYLTSIVLIYLAIKDIDIVSLFNLILNFDTASYIIIWLYFFLSILFTNFRLNFFLNLIGMRLPFLIVSSKYFRLSNRFSFFYQYLAI